MKFLIVEDQKYPRMALKTAVMDVDAFYDIDLATNYKDAESKIVSQSYDVVLLDHRMPRENVGDLESRDMRAFSECLEDIGYSLIPEIKAKNPSTIVIGTSSLSSQELKGLPHPDFSIRKDFDEAKEGLEKVLKEASKK